MDPQLKSILTTIGMTLATSVAAWAASKGIIPSADQSVIANDLVVAAGTVITAALGWYKARQATQTAMIQQVNKADNGVKVVPATAPVDPVNAPINTEVKK